MASVNLIKPSDAAVRDPAQLQALLLKLWEFADAAQKVFESQAVRIITATSADPGPPPAGQVYLYAWQGSLYARTVTASYLVAL